MVPRPTALAPRWYRSLYFRIGFSFVLFAVSVIVAQSALFNYALSRGPYQIRPPNILATMIAADVSSALTQEPALDLKQYLTEGYARAQPIYVLMKGGDVTGNRPAPLSGSLRGVAEAALEGTGFRRLGEDLGTTPATVMAPIQVDGQLRGMVVLPPAPPPNPILRDVGRLLTVQGTALLVVATVLAAAFIFAPARRRLKALQDATHRIGAGDLGVRASEAGGDEISDLAVTFNKMADDLATRDAALRAAAGLRRQMLADVSHELKTPLTAMRGYVETLRMADLTLDPVTRDRYFATLERETFRLDRIVKDLLDLARLEDGGSGIAVRVFAIGRVFELVAQRYEPACGERGIEVRIHVADAVDQIVADPDRIEQVIDNLVANALRHTPAGGTIDIAATAAGSAVQLSITDSGSGIAPEHVGHLFDRFYKVSPSRANGASGSGLGLSIAKAIVEQHRGTITVSSQPGRTVFTIVLPQESSIESEQTVRIVHAT